MFASLAYFDRKIFEALLMLVKCGKFCHPPPPPPRQQHFRETFCIPVIFLQYNNYTMPVVLLYSSNLTKMEKQRE
jgi:hypothetical protein